MNTIHEHVFQKGTSLSAEDERVLDVYGQLTSDDEPYPNQDLYLVWKSEFEDGNNRCYVLRDGNEVAAVANYDAKKDDGVSHLDVIVVDESKRKFGYGTLMMDFLMQQTKEDGNSALSLNADADTSGYYERFGFVVTDSNNPHDVKMTKHL